MYAHWVNGKGAVVYEDSPFFSFVLGEFGYFIHSLVAEVGQGVYEDIFVSGLFPSLWGGFRHRGKTRVLSLVQLLHGESFSMLMDMVSIPRRSCL